MLLLLLWCRTIHLLLKSLHNICNILVDFHVLSNTSIGAAHFTDVQFRIGIFESAFSETHICHTIKHVRVHLHLSFC